MLIAGLGLAPPDAPRALVARSAPARPIARLDPATCLALCVTVGGWSLFWARALELVTLFPVWLAALLFFLGLAMIPLRGAAAARHRAATPIPRSR